MEAVGSSETLVLMYQTTRRHVSEDDNIKSFLHEMLPVAHTTIVDL